MSGQLDGTKMAGGRKSIRPGFQTSGCDLKVQLNPLQCSSDSKALLLYSCDKIILIRQCAGI